MEIQLSKTAAKALVKCFEFYDIADVDTEPGNIRTLELTDNEHRQLRKLYKQLKKQ